MRIIVDANIVFSGILHTKGKIGDLLINSHGILEFIAPDFLRTEIRKHHIKLTRLSGISKENIIESEFQVCRDIKFISEEQILHSTWELAYELVKDIDEKDTHYIAFAKHFSCKIWSGDKKLIRGLKKKGLDIFLDTEELFRLRENLKLRKRKKK